jgi:predicted metalloprotease with PDZ domain
MEIEEEEMVSLADDFISSVCQDIHNRFPKVKRKRLSREESSNDAIYKFWRNSNNVTWTFCAST